MAYGGQRIPEKVMEGRRALHWWWHIYTNEYTPNHALRSRGGTTGWTYQIVKPKRRFGMATGTVGSKQRKVHIVRDQIRGIKPDYPEALLTRWKCGAYTFAAKLQSEAPEKVCYQCHIRDLNQTTVKLP